MYSLIRLGPMAIIPLPSSVVTILYIVLFDVIVPVLLTWCVKVILSARNLRVIYEHRKVLHLQPLLFPAPISQGVSSTRTSLLLAVASTVTFCLAVSGGFAITGISRKEVVSKPVSVLVEAASPGNYVDYSKKASENGDVVSGYVLLAMSSQFCVSLREKSVVIYASYNTLFDLDRIMFPVIGNELVNTTCLVKDNGHVEKVAIHFLRTYNQSLWNQSGCRLQTGNFQSEELKLVNASFEGDCAFQLLDTWCSSYKRIFCVGIVARDRRFSVLTVEYPRNASVEERKLFNNGQPLVEPLFIDYRPESISVRSMAYLLSTTASCHPYEARTLSLLSFRRDAVVEKYISKKKTELNLVQLAATGGAALLFTLCLGLFAFSCWNEVVMKAGRKGYNQFYSPGDMLSCAISETLNDGTCRFKSDKIGVIRICNGEPHLVFDDARDSSDTESFESISTAFASDLG